MENRAEKIVFVTGGVLSSLGKGIIASSIARLFKDQGLKVNMMKCDPYLNVDPGTMSPIEHGEVFVTYDGGETDLDVGHYERFLGQNLSKKSSLTTGRVYSNVLNRERSGGYLGKTVQVIPHITDEIKSKIIENTRGYDVLFVEVGGTVGDIESLPYLETIRQLLTEYPENTYLIHGAYVPYLKASKELKTKPAQHSVKELLGLGIRPDMIVTRNEIALTDKERNKIAMFCNVQKENVIESVDVPSVYQIPLLMKEQDVDKIIARHFKLVLQENEHEKLRETVDKLFHSEGEVNIAIVGKYTSLDDAYISVTEAVKHGAIANGVKAKVDLVSAQELTDEAQLKEYDGIIVAGGFGESGIAGKLLAIKYARENNVPFLGICLGMQLSTIDFARNVCGIAADHQELVPNTKEPIIHLIEGQDLSNLGGTQRLGAYECQITEGTLAHEVYGSTLVEERHRHRYEFNDAYIEALEAKGLVFSGRNPQTGLVEIIENPANDFFIAGQFHPELTSKLTEPNPLFVSLVKYAKAGK
ncbi:CTP synthase [Mollicutes bacterium LVI A0078]|nr:CTP synthase [Mollicutes bacterium LVI A0075]WOO90929.1 CTP synthase [Mollicutes bacterium LVI A0078]